LGGEGLSTQQGVALGSHGCSAGADVPDSGRCRRPIPGDSFQASAGAGSFELTEFMLAVIVLTAIGQPDEKGHISIDILVSRFSPRVQAILDTATDFVSLAMFALVTWRTIKYAQLLYESNDVSGVLRLPVYPFLFVASIGTFMFCLAMLSSLLQSLKKAVKNEP
jgi:TRAP-type C4-dicarboxylate transport system permease small subunit